MLFTPMRIKPGNGVSTIPRALISPARTFRRLYGPRKSGKYGIASEIVTCDVYTNYSVSYRLALLNASKSEEHAELLYEAGLEEKVKRIPLPRWRIRFLLSTGTLPMGVSQLSSSGPTTARLMTL
jgi:hypothetical protein